MPRGPRKLSNTGIYHVMLRGADRRVIFQDDQDNYVFLKKLLQVKQVSPFALYAYCLMGNHVHLLMEERDEPLQTVFKRLGVAYVNYYNQKYELHGHLFQDRFKSEAVETDAYFLDVLRYICQNPVKAGLVTNPFNYNWLGCSSINHSDPLLDSISEYTDMSMTALLDFVLHPCDSGHIEDTGYKRLTDKEAITRICKTCNCTNVLEIGAWPVPVQKIAIKKLLKTGISIRQLSRLTGISKTLIERNK